MDQESISTVVVTAITVLGSTAAWNFYEKRLLLRAKEERERDRERSEYKDDLRERVAVLESKLEKSETDKKQLQTEVVRLVERISALSVEVEYLRKENTSLKERLASQDT